MYPNSKHEDPKALGELYQEKLNPIIKDVFDWELSYFKTQEEQYNRGESAEGWEIKFDDWITKTKRLSVETGEKTKSTLARFSDSGILRKDNTLVYVQGNWNLVWFFEKSTLIKYYIDNSPELITDNPPTIRKFYIGLDVADDLCFRKLKLIPEIKVLRYKILK